MPVSRNQIKFVKSLQQKKFRTLNGCFVVEGIKPVTELLDTPLEVVNLYATSDHIEQFEATSIELISSSDMDRMSGFSSAPGVLAVVRCQAWNTQNWEGFTLVLDGIGDPGNMGTIIRTAEWFGVDRVALTPDCVDIWSPKVVQSAMGSLFRMPCIVIESSALRANLSAEGVQVLAADMGGTNISAVARRQNQALVIGSESQGLSAFWRTSSDETVSIPGKEKTESLNAAVAASILLYALKRD